MDQAGKKLVRLSVVIAAVIAGVIAAALHDIAVWVPLFFLALVLSLVLSFFASILFAVGKVMDEAGKKTLRAAVVIASVIAAASYVVDALVLFREFFDFVLFGVVLLYFLPAALWALRTDRRVAGLRAAKAGIYCIAAVSIGVTVESQNRIADRKAVKLGDACLAYRAKYHHYPQDLNALVPEFISSVPAARYGLFSDRFVYSEKGEYFFGSSENGEYVSFARGPMLSYAHPLPLSLHPDFYDIEHRCLAYTDIRFLGHCYPPNAHSSSDRTHLLSNLSDEQKTAICEGLEPGAHRSATQGREAEK
jgi:hypothetical protein